ncbi:MAG TPA: sigma-70 family RNA polymerase sigma factor [Rhizomicrobium sp.]|jgi:RNA polymerase sigma-70 factor (ECF subfamily)|nr:sigma-70 family RNA polymerase sigma factor [Rhizomicrobium sp.]
MMMTYAPFARTTPAFPRTGRHTPPVVLMRPCDEFEKLLCRVAWERDRSAFQALFEHFAPRVKAYLMRLGTASQPAEDLAQEAMLTLWRKADLFDPAKASAATWVFTIARNLRIDALRRERHTRFDFDDPSMAPDPEEDADVSLETRESEEALRLALAALPTEQAEIVLLSFFSDKPHSQIAAELGIPLGTVKSRLRLAMSRLRAALGENL